MEKENENPHAHYDHNRRKWVMYISESVTGDTKEEAEKRAESLVALYRIAAEEHSRLLAGVAG